MQKLLALLKGGAIMPIIQIKSLPFRKTIDQTKILKEIGNRVSQASGIPINRLVIYWEDIKPNSYIFDGEFSEFTKEDSHHPIVYISCLEGKPEEQEESIISTVAKVLSEELSINKENVAVIFNRIHSRRLFVKGDFII